MVAYSFKKRFSPRIVDGSKQGTIRADRKRHARAGEALQLYEAMRTKHCRKIVPDLDCLAVLPVSILLGASSIAEIAVEGRKLSPKEIDKFAGLDGFSDATEMHEFWASTHGMGRFSGQWIVWGYNAMDLVMGFRS